MSETVRLIERAGKPSAQRRQGLVPVVIYGAGSESLSLSADAKTVDNILSRNPRAILKAELPSAGTKDVIINEVQRQPLTKKLLHIDFHVIDMKTELETKVALHFTGTAEGVKDGGIQTVELHEIDIRTLPDKLEPTLEVDVSGLAIGDQLFVSDLPKHEGWEVLNDPETLVVKIAPPAVTEEPAAEEGEAPAAVEVAAEGTEGKEA
ncbi:50S ribosomal protein L25 [Paenibacillus sp. HN-1]|uniref:50S ribosomal protein L25 n=1 Tax=Paenibacillus TaxID=44249 RepID=UPI001CA9F9D0|nr:MULTISPECIES: 50S ribosomal protein L25 [Paenibacillus]MBY9081736.1 50S ribosomal protein L25 [Paenibacillus sp. CGMCC 1.18879]MBY9083605.1 50S ribosomal protein L25 [Paenibacillus sinensis]